LLSGTEPGMTAKCGFRRSRSRIPIGSRPPKVGEMGLWCHCGTVSAQR
jgi:hypothetical protein